MKRENRRSSIHCAQCGFGGIANNALIWWVHDDHPGKAFCSELCAENYDREHERDQEELVNVDGGR